MAGLEFTHRALLAAGLVLALAAALRYRGGYYSPARRVLLTGLRLLALAALVPVAGGLVVPPPPGPPQFLVLEDVSASIAPAGAAARDAFVAGLRRRVPAADLRVVRFAAEPLTGRAAAAPDATAPDPSRTDLAAALEYAKGLADPRRRAALVLLSDGEENEGAALASVAGLKRAGIRVLARDIGGGAGAAPSIRRVSAPRRVLPGESFPVGVAVSAEPGRALRVRLSAGAGPPEYREVRPDGQGEAEATFPQRAPRAGALRLRLALEDADGRPLPAGERILEVAVARPVPVTVLTNGAYEVRALTDLLAGAGLPVTVLEPEAWRTLPASPGDSGVILLDNLPASALGGEGMDKLERLVRADGAGLLALGGLLSFGAGDWGETPLERALPVAMEAPARGADADLGLVIVLDASLSMFFRGRGEEIFVGSGPRKMDLAKTAILEIVRSLRPGDRIGLIESKDELSWVQRLGPVADRADLEARVLGVKAYGGGINFYSSVREAAAALRGDPAAIRHIMVLADANDIDQLEVESVGRSEELIRSMAAERITLSIFALGNPRDKDIAFLRHMAQLGRGDFYLVADMLSLPRYFRSEYRKKTGEQFREEEFEPLLRSTSPLLRGLEAERLPPVTGMNLVTIKAGAEELLVAPNGAPLLALWHYGKGRTAAFTGDNGARWAAGWLSWPDAERFWTQLIHEVAPRAAPPPFELRGERAGGQAGLALRRADGRLLGPADGRLRLEGGAGAGFSAPLQRVGLHRFVAPLDAGATGAAAVVVEGDLVGGLAGVRGSLDLPPPAEYAPPGRGRALLESLAHATGGAIVTTPEEAAGLMAPEQRTAWPAPLFWLLLAALLALFGEILIRY